MSRIGNRLYTIGLFTLLLSLLLLGCSDADGEAPGDSAGSPELGATDTTSADGDLRGGVFREPEPTERLDVAFLASPPESLNPWRDPSSVGLLLFPRTLRRNPETLEWEPWLAESWHVDEDRRGIEVTLRDGSRWSDGTPMVAADWVLPANRYFSDAGLRTPYRDAPEYAGLEPRWFDLGPHRFRIVVDRPTDPSTLLSLARLPPLPARIFEGSESVATAQLNALWRLEGNSPDPPVSGGPYLLDSVAEETGDAQRFRLTRNSAYLDPERGAPAAGELLLRYLREDTGDIGGADLIYLAPEVARNGISVPQGYRRLLVGADLTPAVLFLSSDAAGGGELRRLAGAARRSYLDALGGDSQRPGAAGDRRSIGAAAPLVERRYPGLGELPGVLPGGGGDTTAAGADEAQARGDGVGDDDAAGETGTTVRMVVLDRPSLRGFAETFLALPGAEGIEVTYRSATGIAESLLAPESWELLLTEISEYPEPRLGDPLLGNTLPLTGEWSLLAAGTPPGALNAPPLPTGELPLLREREFDPEGLRATLLRLWRSIADSDREADRERAIAAYRELWDRYEPWIYLFDEERYHYVAGDLGNLLFRDIPGVELGTVLPYIYREE